jgi:isoquinoline 1-oxidoreductase beta subunit
MLRQLDLYARAAAQPVAPRTTIIEKVSRRGFLKGTAAFALAVQFLPFDAKAYETYPHGGLDMPNGVVNNPLIFVSIDRDGTVTIVAHRSEMGTGSRTSIPMVVADEMEADWSRVRIVQAEGDEKKYGNQDTDGSRSLRHHIQPARDIGAAMRRMLEEAAAQRWQTDVANVQAVNHEVVHKTLGLRLGYGELAEAAMALPVPPRSALRFKDEKEFRYIGKGQVKIVDLHDITTGKAVYAADVRLPGMLTAVVARPPVVGGKVKSFDAAAARAVPGVLHVIEIPGSGLGSKFKPLGGIAVVARNTWAAIQGRDALTIEWDSGPHGSSSTAAQEKELRASASAPGAPVRDQGDAEAALASAAKVFTREYYQPHMVHAPMEPPAALAAFKDGKCEVWSCVQSPYVARVDIADFLGLGEEDVTVNVTLLGGGFGRKSKADFAIEAAWLSREVGAPVRVQWTREDDIRHSYYHTTAVEKIDIGLDADNRPVAWRHRSAQPSLLTTFAPDEGVQHPVEIGMGLEDMPYDIPNVRAEQCKAYAHTRVGWYRSVSHIMRCFAIQSITAELAHELGRDEKDFLLEMIGAPRKLDWRTAGLPQDFWNHGEPSGEFPIDTGRLRNVAELAAEKAGWGRSLPPGEGLGIAVHRSFVSYIAMVVHARVGSDGKVEVPETHVAVDCGFVANPERVQSQMQGACVFGMTAAMYSGITLENGAVVESNFHDYEMVRADAFPQVVHTHIVEHPFAVHATGVGEPGVPPFLPALTNAIFNATGKRIRNLPIRDQLAT